MPSRPTEIRTTLGSMPTWTFSSAVSSRCDATTGWDKVVVTSPRLGTNFTNLSRLTMAWAASYPPFKDIETMAPDPRERSRAAWAASGWEASPG